jgi:hypothetical protein
MELKAAQYTSKSHNPIQFGSSNGRRLCHYNTKSKVKVQLLAPCKRFRSLNCNCIYSGSEPPDACPVCGASHDCFESLSEAAETATQAEKAGKVVVVGAILLGNAKLATQVKKAVEGRCDFSGLLAKHPTAEDVLGFLIE